MDKNIQARIDEFNSRLGSLYSDVSSWVQDFGLSIKEVEKMNTEERSGNYKTKKLEILKDGKKIAELNPIGMWIIGAEARVDLETDISKETFAYQGKRKPDVEATLSTGGEVKNKSFSYNYKDKQEGWHWIDDRIVGKTPLLDKDIFLNVLDHIS